MYDPANDSWTLVGNLTKSRYLHSAVRLRSGKASGACAACGPRAGPGPAAGLGVEGLPVGPDTPGCSLHRDHAAGRGLLCPPALAPTSNARPSL